MIYIHWMNAFYFSYCCGADIQSRIETSETSMNPETLPVDALISRQSRVIWIIQIVLDNSNDPSNREWP